MQISKLALIAAMFAGQSTPVSRMFYGVSPIGNRSNPPHIQDQLINLAIARRAERSNKLLWDALTRDSRYYRVRFGSNANRFRKISFLESSKSQE